MMEISDFCKKFDIDETLLPEVDPYKPTKSTHVGIVTLSITPEYEHVIFVNGYYSYDGKTHLSANENRRSNNGNVKNRFIGLYELSLVTSYVAKEL